MTLALGFMALMFASLWIFTAAVSNGKIQDLEARLHAVGKAIAAGAACSHRWRFAGANPSENFTTVMMRCSGCGAPLFSVVVGRWPEDQIRAALETGELEDLAR